MPPSRLSTSCTVRGAPACAAQRPARSGVAGRAVGSVASLVLGLCAAPGRAEPPPALQSSTELAPAPRGEQARQRPIILRADALRARPDLQAVAEGDAELRRAGSVIRADRISYDSAEDLAVARGNVRISREGSLYHGPVLQLKLQRFEGFFLNPGFEFTALGAGGRAERVDFLDASRSVARHAVYSSCPRDGSADPDWLLSTDRVKLDFDANEGLAEGAVLRFLGVPILGLPALSFPLTDDRKSGWLPPSVGLDSRSGFTFGMPYYWNLAPNRDATLTPTVLTRRGIGAQAEFRYLEAHDRGRIDVDLLPDDKVAGRSRNAWMLEHEGDSGAGLRYRVNLLRVSDDAYWKDFSRAVPSITPRLLPFDLRAERDLATPIGAARVYARVQQWQVLQASDAAGAIVAPYERSPQLGARLLSTAVGGLQLALETEVNRFTRPDASASPGLPTGWRWHTLGQLSRSWGDAGWWLAPRLTFNGAAYATDQANGGVRHASRLITTASIDAGMVFERDSRWFGQRQRQTLEPRLLYVNTPYRDQSGLPNYDSAERDFNVISAYAENAFTGIDRVSDAHQLTAGVTTRLVDAATGAETLRLGLAQRLRLRDQRVVLPDDAAPLRQKVSDLLLEASTSMLRSWQLDAVLQYNPDSQRVERSIVGARFSPGPLRTVSAGYRLAPGLSRQLELGWQWPVYRGTSRPVGAAGGCGGTLYAVGRVNYSLPDSRLTDSIVGAEYDAGCWIGRVVAERLSTGRSEATTRLLLQLELVGLSRLGSNPLQVLKDNIPGYRLLRESRGAAPLDGNP